MEDLKKTDTLEALWFYNSDDRVSSPERRRVYFFLTLSSKEYRQLRYELENNVVVVPHNIFVNADERKSDDDNSWLRFAAYGKRYLKTDAVDFTPPLSSHISLDDFRSIYEANADPNVIACIGIVEA